MMAGRFVYSLSGAAALMVLAAPARAQDETVHRPMSYLEAFGSPAKDIAPLTMGLLLLSVTVVLIVALLVAVGLARRARSGSAIEGDQASVRRADNKVALRLIYSGLALTNIILIAFTVWTVQVLATIDRPDREPALTVKVTGHQWWWDLEYSRPNGDRFTTANEIHIPVGEPVRFELTSADVIHSFWVPALGGKTDLIPGQTNTAWLQADTPGVFRGQCAEYCGLQHANMALRVVAQPRDEFDIWFEREMAPARLASGTEAATEMQTAFVRNCAACHAVRGTAAGGEMGPDLTHVMSRSTLAAGLMPNTKGHMAGWISNPEHLKPGTPMPNPDLDGPELHAVLDYVMTLE